MSTLSPSTQSLPSLSTPQRYGDRCAGTSRAAFYLYFPPKEELLHRMYNQVIATSQAAIEQIVAETLPMAEKPRRIIRHQVRYMALNIPLAHVFFSEIFHLRPELGQ